MRTIRSHTDSAMTNTSRQSRSRIHIILPFSRSISFAALFILLLLVPLDVGCSASTPDLSFQLNSDAYRIEQFFPKNTQSSQTSVQQQKQKYAERSINKLNGAVVTASGPLMFRAAAAYHAIDPYFSSEFTTSATNSVVKQAFLAGDKYDYLVTATAPSATDFVTMPTMTYLPLHGAAIVVAYNLPSTVGSGVTLALDGPTICKIMRGNITQWDDPSIKATNPKMNFASAAGKGIVILMQNSGGSTQLALSSFCYKIDPMYAQLDIRPANNPAYPTSLYAGLKKYADSDRVNNAVSDEVWSFAITTWNSAKQIGVPISHFVDITGVVISPSFNSMSLTLFELGTNGYPDGSYGFDLTNPSTPHAWPFVSMSYLHIEKSSSLTTCATKKMMVWKGA